MRRVMYLYLPRWPIDRLRRLGEKRPVSKSGHSAAPADPPIDGAPFATIVAEGGRRLLAALNPAAEAAGLAPGMPLADALSFVPGLATVPADPAADSAALTRLAEWCGRYSPWTAPDHQSNGGADGIKIEITGCAHLWGGEAALAADLSRRLAQPINSERGIAHRIAIASTLGAAWALARHAAVEADPVIAQIGEERAALASLPVEALRLDRDTVRDLRRVGLRTVGELCPMPRDALARRFGASGTENIVARRLDQAFGDLPEPLSPLGEAPLRRVRLSFAEPISDPTDLARAIERLVGDLVPRLEREGMGARRLTLGFHRVDGRVEHIVIGTARPSRDPRHLTALFRGRLNTVDPGLGIEDMILAVFVVDPLPPEQADFVGNSPEAAAHDIASLIDRLGNRFGLDALRRLEPRESHIPERASVNVAIGGAGKDQPVSRRTTSSSYRRRPVSTAEVGPGLRRDDNPKQDKGTDLEKSRRKSTPSPPPGAERAGVRWGIPERSPIPTSLSPLKGGEGFACGGTAKPPRPVRLFDRPEPVAASWLVPDSPPVQFTWRRRRYRVARADGPERIAEEWWSEDGSAAANAIRDYYRVEDAEGRRFWLYRAGLAQSEPPPRWFVHGLFA